MRRVFLFCFVSALLVLASACGGDDDSPTAPEAEPQVTEHIRFTFTAQRFEALADGDGIEGAGDFEWVVRAGSFNESWEAAVSTGSSHPMNWTRTWGYLYDGNAREVEIYFSCVEWDKDVLGREFADSDMDWRSATAVETIDVGEVITNYITLGNSNCRVRLHYRLEAELIRSDE